MLESIHEFAKFAAAAGHYIDLGLSSEQVILLFRECYLITVHHDDKLQKFCMYAARLVCLRDIVLPQVEALGLACIVNSSEILQEIGDAYEGLNELEKAIEYYQRSIHAAQEVGSRHEEMMSNLKIGRAYISLGCQNDTIPYLVKSAELAEVVDDFLAQVAANNRLVNIYITQCKYQEAKRCCLKWVEASKKIGQYRYVADGYKVLMLISEKLNQFADVISSGKKYIELAISIQDREGNVSGDLACAHYQIGNAYYISEDYPNAIEHYKSGFELSMESDGTYIECSVCLGFLYFHEMKDPKTAIYYSNICKDCAYKANKLDVELLACTILGESCQSLNQHKEAIVYFDHCITLAHYLEHEDLFMAYKASVASHIDLKEYNLAVKACRLCISLAKEQKDKDKELEAEMLLIQTYLDFEKYEYAILYGKRCLELAKNSGSIADELKAYLKLGYSHKSIGNSRQVIQHCHTCLQLIEKYPQVDIDREFKVAALLLLAEELTIRKQYDDAIMYGERCYEILVKKDDERLIGRVCFHLAFTCFLQSQCSSKRTDIVIKENCTELEIPKTHSITQSQILFETASEKAIHYSNKAISVSKGHDLLKGYLLLARCYSCLGKHQEVIDNIMLYISNHNDHFYNCPSSTCKYYTMECLLLLANSKEQLKLYDESVGFATRCATIAKECSNKETQCKALVFAGDGHQSLSQLDKAYFCYTKGLKLAEELQDRTMIQLFKNTLERFHRRVGIKDDPQSEDSTNFRRIFGENVYKLMKDANDCISENNYGGALSCFEQIQALLEDQHLQRDYKLLGKYLNMMNIGDMHDLLKDYNNALRAYNKTLQYFKDSGDNASYEAACHFKIGLLLFEVHGPNGLPDVEKCIRKAIECFERVLSSFGDNEKLSISYVDSYMTYYSTLTAILLESNRNVEALEVLDCYRARTLKRQLLPNNEIKKSDVSTGALQFKEVQSLVCDHNFTIAQYCAPRYIHKLYALLVLPKNEGKLFVNQQKECSNEHLETNVQFSLNQLNVRDMNCEDRSMTTKDSFSEHFGIKGVNFLCAKFEQTLTFRSPTGESQGISSSENGLEILYNKLIGNIISNVQTDEIVFIPDGPLFKVPFAALRDPKTGIYLSETKRVRIAPSISTLKILSDRPADFECQTGSLIIGDPTVGKVLYNGKEVEFPPLYMAFIESLKIRKILGGQMLVQEEATKAAVLEKLKKGVSVLHIAAHGDANKAMIALAPSPEIRASKIPGEEDYMLTMADVQNAKPRAKLVVLSCCHSGRGEIKAEGVVGMCRAFLASGARAVIGSLWAIDDDATLEFMTQFYQNLSQKKSASLSLQLAMKYMRTAEKYRHPKFWAPFYLMGDDVIIDVN